MNRRSFTTLALAGVAAVALSACAGEPQGQTIRDVINSNASLSTLAQALDVAGVQSLSANGPFTVFAPTNAAFAALPEGTLDSLLLPENVDQLRQILELHVVPGAYPAAELANRTTTVETASGLNIIIDGFNGVNVGGVNVTQPDVNASNGIIHVVDGVIRPPAN